MSERGVALRCVVLRRIAVVWDLQASHAQSVNPC